MLKDKRRYKVNNYNSRVASYPSLHISNENIRFGSIVTWSCWCFIGIIALILFYFSGLHLYRLITTSNFFCIERINIYGASFFHRSDILKYTNLQTGINSFSVNIGKIEKILSSNPWVEKVSVKRRLPGIFDIFIKEYEPSFWVLKDDIIYYADSVGRIITPLDTDNFKSLPTLEVMEGGEKFLPILKDLIVFLESSNSIIDVGTISSVRLSSASGIEILLENYDIVLSFEPQAWKENLKKLCLVLSDLACRGELKQTRSVTAVATGVWVSQEKIF